MQLTKGAIGNLINRYTAVLKKCRLMNTFGSLAVAGMLVMGGAGMVGAAETDWGTAETPITGYTWNGEETVTHTGDVYINTTSQDAFLAYQDGYQSNKPAYVPTHTSEKGTISLGSNSSIIVIGSSVITGNSYGVTVFDNSNLAHSDQLNLNLKGDTISISAESAHGYASALHVSSDVTLYNKEKNNTISITSKNGTFIYAKGTTGATAIEAMSGGILNISGPLTAKAELKDGSKGDVIYARGGATINIGAQGETVKLDGNINFGYEGTTSGTGVDAFVNVTLTGADSYWEGNTITSWSPDKPDDEKLDVTNLKVALNKGATWRPTAVENSESKDQQYTALNKLTLDDGIVDVKEGVEVEIEKISGSGTIANAGTMSLGATDTGELGGTIDNTGTMNITGAVTLAQGSSYTQSGEGSLTVKEGATLANKGAMTINGGSLTVKGTATFADDSLLAVNGNALTGNNAAITVDGGTLTVEDKARLRIDNAQNGQRVNIVDGSNSTWKEIEAGTDLLTPTMDEDGNVTFSRDKDASDVFTGMDGNTAAMLNSLIDKGLNDADSNQMGVRFLSRTVEKAYLGSDKKAAAESIESATRIAFAGAAPQMTKMASDAATNAVVNRLGFANPVDGAQAINSEGKIVDRDTTGFALWIAPLWQSRNGWGLEAGNMDYGFNGNLGGVSLGADYTFENALRAGITFNIGGGYAESSGGDLSSTENRMNFWGLGAYAGWNYENFGVMADVSYTSTWNQLKQDLDSRLGMGNELEADVQATAISAGLRAEYLLKTSALDIIPHIGVRYMSLNTWGYDVEANGGNVLEGDSLHQDIWTFPIGVTFSKEFATDSGWNFKPSLDFTVIPAAGDIEARHDVRFTGLPGTYEVETRMMDYLTWQGGVGLELANDNMSIGVNYTLQAGQHTTGHGVFGSFRYEF